MNQAHAKKTRSLPIFIAAGILLGVFLVASIGCVEAGAADGPNAPEFGGTFWSHWGDGRAEVAGYELTFPRYGKKRDGVAVTIFVTEPFSDSVRVKADPGKHPESDVFQVMKLNLVRDFPTGIYDYNMMTSVFVGLEPFDGKPAGSPAKVSFSSQEWCGQVYQQVIWRGSRAEITSHSYFDGEADQARATPVPADGMSEDALFHWARGLAGPVVASGSTKRVSVLRSLMKSRLGHDEVAWLSATLGVGEETERIEVPAGEFEVTRRTVSFGDAGTMTFWVETGYPHRIIRWESSDGEVASLLGSERLEYWKMNGPEFIDAVEKFGLRRRGERMP